MAENRKDAIRRLGATSNQEALVKRLKHTTNKPFIFTIPGGKSLTEQLDRKGLETACWTWLRACKAFTEVTVSLAAEGTSFRTKETKILDFMPRGTTPEWEVKPQGKRWLGEQIAQALFENEAVAVRATLDGLYLVLPAEELEQKFNQDHPEWEPHLKFLKRREPWSEK